MAYREENGAFTDRRQLKKVAARPEGLFQLRGLPAHHGGDEPPRCHERAPRELPRGDRGAQARGRVKPRRWRRRHPDIKTRVGARVRACRRARLRRADPCATSSAELEKPGRDPRDDAPEAVFSRSVQVTFDDLACGMELKGTVRNVVDFGAFVDIGVKQDGLVHISKLADRFVKHPSEVVAVGDTVTVWVCGVDKDRGKISLSMVKDRC